MNDSITTGAGLTRRGFLAATGLTAAGLVGASTLAACGSEESPSGSGGGDGKELTKIGFDYSYPFLPVFAGVSRYAKERAKELGVDLEFTNDQGQSELQVANVNTWVTQKMPAIVSFPAVFDAMEAPAKKALDAGLIWVTYGGVMENQSASIQFSFSESGKLIGEAGAEWANEQLGGKGKVAFLVEQNILLGQQRTKGMIDAFKAAAPNIEVVAQEQAITPDDGFAKTNAILSRHKDVNLVLATLDGAAFGAYRALTKAGRAEDDPNTFIGGQDGDIGSLELIAKGTIYRASAALSNKDLGYAVIDVPKAVADGKSDEEASVQIPVTLVRKGDEALQTLMSQWA